MCFDNDFGKGRAVREQLSEVRSFKNGTESGADQPSQSFSTLQGRLHKDAERMGVDSIHISLLLQPTDFKHRIEKGEASYPASLHPADMRGRHLIICSPPLSCSIGEAPLIEPCWPGDPA